MTREDKFALAAAISSIAIFATAGSLILPALTLNLEMRGFSSAAIGVMGACIGLAAVLGTPFAPRIVRKFGAKKSLILPLLIVATADLSYKLTEDFPHAWFGIYFASCFALALIFVTAETVVTTLAPPSRRGLILGVYATGFSTGFTLGPLILRFTGIDGWAPFASAAALAVLAAAMAAAAKIRKIEVPETNRAGFSRMFWAAPLPFVCAFSLGAAEISVYDLLPIYARKLEYSVADAVFLLAVFSIGAAVLQPAVGGVADRFNSRRTLAAAAGFGAVGAALLPVLVGGGAAEWDWGGAARTACLGLWGGLLMAVYPLGLAQAARHFPPPKLAAANAFFGFSYGGGALFGPALTGVFMDISPHGIVPALVFFASLPLFALFAKKSAPAP